MAHARTQIRAAVKALLMDATSAAGRVHTRIVRQQETTPALFLELGDEDMEALAIEVADGTLLQRQPDLRVIGLVDAGDGGEWQDALDALLAEVEPLLAGIELGGCFLSWPAALRVKSPVEGGASLAAFVLTYRPEYHTAAADPETLNP